ncbi:unnamed protein product [Owenia fusiformis]|uniref:GrpE protein homolog n=1 Tax=Owenia fusiformis TaxID=6347 RepID=A0A8J1XGN3_OWEFU|nr:unnamed protein product [Owenia fusiformis]
MIAPQNFLEVSRNHTRTNMAALSACFRATRSLVGFNSSILARSTHLRSPQQSRHWSTTATEENVDSKEEKTDKPEEKPEISDIEKSLREEKQKLLDQIADVQDKYKRSLAETENVRTRMKKQVDDAKIFGIQGFCKDLLEVADILGKATESVPPDALTGDPYLKSMHEGLTMTETQLQKVFNKHNLIMINPDVGEVFDPNFHEALFQTPMEGKEDNTIAVVTKVGYRLHERTIRAALVGVVKSPS